MAVTADFNQKEILLYGLNTSSLLLRDYLLGLWGFPKSKLFSLSWLGLLSWTSKCSKSSMHLPIAVGLIRWRILSMGNFTTPAGNNCLKSGEGELKPYQSVFFVALKSCCNGHSLATMYISFNFMVLFNAWHECSVKHSMNELCIEDRTMYNIYCSQ